jgi:hypothetical protein
MDGSKHESGVGVSGSAFPFRLVMLDNAEILHASVGRSSVNFAMFSAHP